MTQPSARSPIVYIRPDIPPFDLPAYPGARYEARVPDTLDLQERCALAVNGLTGPTDPDADYELYWAASLRGDRPVMDHDHNDHVQIKFNESLPLMRLASGSQLNRHVEQRWMEVLLHMRGPDGLLYYPIRGRPWLTRNLINEQFGPLPNADHYTQPYNNGRLLAAVTLYHLVTGDPLWLELGRGMVDGLWRLAVDRGDYAYMPRMQLGPADTVDPAEPITPWRSMVNAWVLMGLAQHYHVSGYEPARTLAGKIARHLVRYAGTFSADAAFLPEEPDNRDLAQRAHFHGHTYQLLALLEYALTVDDGDLLAFVRRGYDYAVAHGEPLTGFFPEWIDPGRPHNGEVCGVADMVALALKLSAGGVAGTAGAADCWDDADRWLRNHLAEGQLTRAEWWYRVGEGQPAPTVDYSYQTDDRVAERNVGAFASQPPPNDFGRCIAHCCTGNGTRSLYYAWEHSLHYRDGTLRVNLLLNRASPWADVDSHIPYQGRVDVRVKRDLALSVRIPEWAKPEQARASVNGQARPLGWQGRYAQLGAVPAGSVATLTFPIAERTDRVVIEGSEYALLRKGNEVVQIDPPGRDGTFYQRSHCREHDTRWRSIERFVPEHPVDW